MFMRVGNGSLARRMDSWPYAAPVLGAAATRENYFCIWCRRNWRMRQLAGHVRAHVRCARVYEPATRGVLARRLQRAAASYSVSEYFDGAAPGSTIGGIRHEDLQQLTFDDGAFDLVITSEVLEHVADPWLAFKEIRRVLRPGGRHVFTVPTIPGTVTRSRRGLPVVYHGDPMRSDGALVVTDYGDDLPDLLRLHGFDTSVHPLPHERPIVRIYDSVAVT
jgi:SAM-dependent methyltransferase